MAKMCFRPRKRISIIYRKPSEIKPWALLKVNRKSPAAYYAYLPWSLVSCAQSPERVAIYCNQQGHIVLPLSGWYRLLFNRTNSVTDMHTDGQKQQAADYRNHAWHFVISVAWSWRQDIRITSFRDNSPLKRSGFSRVNKGPHGYTCHPHVYPRMEWAIQPLLPMAQRITAFWPVLISRPTEGRRLS